MNESEKEPWEVADGVLREEPDVVLPVYDLEERTAKFGEAVIDLCSKNPVGPRTNRLIDQLTGCGTSIGGNYGEADDALSKKDFAKTIGICRKEARETKFFIRMIARACPDLKPDLRRLWNEAHELHLIFSKIWRTPRRQQPAATLTKTKTNSVFIRHSSLITFRRGTGAGMTSQIKNTRGALLSVHSQQASAGTEG